MSAEDGVVPALAGVTPGSPPPAEIVPLPVDRPETGRLTAFEEVVREHGRGLTQLAFFLCRDRAGAEDLVAEAMARTWPRWRDGHVEDLLPYLRRTLVNLTFRSRHRQLLARRYEEQFDAMIDTTSPHEHLAGSFDLSRAVLGLPLPQRAVILLRYFQDLSEAEVAEALGISKGTVKSRTSRALDALRERCGEQADV